MGYVLPHDRSGEKGFVSVNGNVCSTKGFSAAEGSQQCGSLRSGWNELPQGLECEGNAVNGKLTVQVYSNLGSDHGSFAIDQVYLRQIPGTVVGSVLKCSLFC